MLPREKIVEKIKKLLALTSTSNENESLQFNARAQELITKYQIEEAELNVKNNVKVEFTSISLIIGNKSSILWKEKLTDDLCRNNNCILIIHKKPADEGSRITTYNIWGSNSNIELVCILFELISNQVEYFAKNSGCKGKSELNSFKLGVVTRVGQRLKESKKETISEWLKLSPATNIGNKALVLLNKEMRDLEIFVAKAIPKLGVRQMNSVNLRKDAYDAGLKKGDSIVLQNCKALK